VQIVLSNFEDNGLVGIEPAGGSHIRVYPNPFTDEARVEFDSPSGHDYEASVRDLAGKTVKTIGKVNGTSFIVYRENLAPGNYLLEIRNSEEILHCRLVLIK
jgi:hypothetical protein